MLTTDAARPLATRFARKWERGWHPGNDRRDPLWTLAGERRDPNPTLDGITLATWRRQNLVPADVDGDGDVDADDLRLATPEAIEAIYGDYWRRARCPEIAAFAPRLAVVQFDSSLQHGKYAVLFQRAVHAVPDGVIGPKTLDAARVRVAQMGDAQMACVLMDRRRAYYGQLMVWTPALVANRNGWRNRMNDLAKTLGLDWQWK